MRLKLHRKELVDGLHNVDPERNKELTTVQQESEYEIADRQSF